MSTPWEIDPTEPDRDGAGAEGGAMGGDSAGDSTLPPPLQPPEDIDRTNPFQPTGASTPYPHDDDGETIELSSLPDEEADAFLGPDHIPSVTEVDFVDADEKKRQLERVKMFIKGKFPKVDFAKLGPIGLGKRIENRFKLVKFGGRGGESRIIKADNSGLLKSFVDSNREALGKSAEELETEKKQLQKRQDKTLKEVKQSIGKLKKDIFATTKERNEIELGLNRTKPLNEREERYETLKRENEEDRKVVDDDNATSSDKQAVL